MTTRRLTSYIEKSGMSGVPQGATSHGELNGPGSSSLLAHKTVNE